MDNDKIRLHIHPVIDKVQEEKKVIQVSDQQTMLLPLAETTSRETDTTVELDSAQIIVLGGLMQDSARTSQTGSEKLGLYPSHNDEGETTELVILLKATTIKNNGSWTDEIKKMQKKFNNNMLTPVNK